MAFPSQTTLISSTTNASASTAAGGVSLGAIANKWAVLLVATGQSAPNALPTLNFAASCDGTNFGPVAPAAQRGNWFVFDTPAEYIVCTMANNSGTAAVFAVGLSD